MNHEFAHAIWQCLAREHKRNDFYPPDPAMGTDDVAEIGFAWEDEFVGLQSGIPSGSMRLPMGYVLSEFNSREDVSRGRLHPYNHKGELAVADKLESMFDKWYAPIPSKYFVDLFTSDFWRGVFSSGDTKPKTLAPYIVLKKNGVLDSENLGRYSHLRQVLTVDELKGKGDLKEAGFFDGVGRYFGPDLPVLQEQYLLNLEKVIDREDMFAEMVDIPGWNYGNVMDRPPDLRLGEPGDYRDVGRHLSGNWSSVANICSSIGSIKTSWTASRRRITSKSDCSYTG